VSLCHCVTVQSKRVYLLCVPVSLCSLCRARGVYLPLCPCVTVSLCRARGAPASCAPRALGPPTAHPPAGAAPMPGAAGDSLSPGRVTGILSSPGTPSPAGPAHRDAGTGTAGAGAGASGGCGCGQVAGGAGAGGAGAGVGGQVMRGVGNIHCSLSGGSEGLARGPWTPLCTALPESRLQGPVTCHANGPPEHLDAPETSSGHTGATSSDSNTNNAASSSSDSTGEGEQREGQQRLHCQWSPLTTLPGATASWRREESRRRRVQGRRFPTRPSLLASCRGVLPLVQYGHVHDLEERLRGAVPAPAHCVQVHRIHHLPWTAHRGTLPLAAQHSTVHCCTVQYTAVQYSTLLYSTVHCCTVQYTAVQYSTLLYSTVSSPVSCPLTSVLPWRRSAWLSRLCSSTVRYSTEQSINRVIYSTVCHSTARALCLVCRRQKV